MSDGPWSEIGAAVASLVAGIGGVLGVQKYQARQESSDPDPKRSTTGAHTVRLQTQKERLHNMEERLTRSSKILFDKCEELERRSVRFSAAADKADMILARLIEVEDKVSQHHAEIAVLKDRTTRHG